MNSWIVPIQFLFLFLLSPGNGSKPHHALREFGRTDKLSKAAKQAAQRKYIDAWCTKRKDENWAKPTDFQIREVMKLLTKDEIEKKQQQLNAPAGSCH